MTHVKPRHIVVAIELLGAGLLLAACGGGSSGTSATETSAAAPEQTSATADDSMAAEAARASDEAARKAADGTGPSANDPVKVAEVREKAEATGFAKPKVSALEFTWDVSPARQALLAKYGLVLIDKGRTRGWAAYNAFASGIKAHNPSTKIGQYVINGEVKCYPSSSSDQFASLIAATNSADFWLHRANGSRAQWTTAYGACDINITSWGKRTSAGQTWQNLKWNSDRNAYFGPTPKMDYVFIDTIFNQGRSTADWKRIKTNQSPADAAVAAAYRSGQAAYFNEVRRTNPGLKLLGNTDNNLTDWTYKGQLEGALLEAEMGKSWSTEAIKGWAASLSRYKTVMQNTRWPHDVIYQAFGNTYDYKAMRYGLATAMMDNGYYQFRDYSASVTPVWYDEYSAQIGTPIDGPPYAATSNGIWTRRYSNGIVLVNPQKWTATINLPPLYKRLYGYQDRGVNNGAYQTSITLPARSGLLMIKR